MDMALLVLWWYIMPSVLVNRFAEMASEAFFPVEVVEELWWRVFVPTPLHPSKVPRPYE